MAQLKRALMIILMCGMVAVGVKLHRDIGNVMDHDCADPGYCVISGLSTLIEQAKLSTVHISVNDKMWQGSGVIIDEHTILTAGHVIDGADSVEIMLSNGYFLRAESWYRDSNNDCGIVKFKEEFLPSRISKLADPNSITVGLPVLVVGSPYGDRFFNTVSFGTVSGLGRNARWQWPDVVTLDCLADPGYSGGPVFNMDGEIIGIVVGTYSWYGNATVITPVRVLREMLVEYEKGRNAKTVESDMSLDES